LNFPPTPARDLQDTFFVSGKYLLRTTHLPAQIRVMENQSPLCDHRSRQGLQEWASVPGALPLSSSGGALCRSWVTFSDLKGTPGPPHLRGSFTGDDKVPLQTELFFPLPSPEMDINLVSYARGKGCKVCKFTGLA